MHFNTKDLTGQRFGKLTVLGFDQTSIGKGRARWICTCDCDPSSRVSVLSSHLKKKELLNLAVALEMLKIWLERTLDGLPL